VAKSNVYGGVQANRQNLSISTRPHPAVCLRSYRPVSGLISEQLIKTIAQIGYLPMHKIHSGHTAKLSYLPLRGQYRNYMVYQNLAMRTDFPFHSSFNQTTD